MQETGARRTAMGRRQQMKRRRQRGSKDVWNGQARGRARAISKAGEDPILADLSFLERVSVSHGTETKYKKRVEQFLSFADEEKLALVADDEVDAAIVQYLNTSYSQGRLVSDGEVLLAGLLFRTEKLEGQRITRSVVESSEGLEKEGSDTIKTTITRVIWSGVCWEMVRNKKPLVDVLPTWGTQSFSLKLLITTRAASRVEKHE